MLKLAGVGVFSAFYFKRLERAYSRGWKDGLTGSIDYEVKRCETVLAHSKQIIKHMAYP
jgi:hypothetical protein